MLSARYQYQWTTKRDPRHTITLNGAADADEACRMAEGFIRQLRPGVPWRIVGDVFTVAEGVGPDSFPSGGVRR